MSNDAVCRGNLQSFTETILTQMQDLLILNTPDKNGHVTWLTNEEQMFLYEVASQLIVSSELSVEVRYTIAGTDTFLSTTGYTFPLCTE